MVLLGNQTRMTAPFWMFIGLVLNSLARGATRCCNSPDSNDLHSCNKAVLPGLSGDNSYETSPLVPLTKAVDPKAKAAQSLDCMPCRSNGSRSLIIFSAVTTIQAAKRS